MAEIFVAHGARSIEDTLIMSVNSVSKQHQKGQSILVFCRDVNIATKFSEGLWGIDKTSFIPHYFAGDEMIIPARIIICDEDIGKWASKLNPKPNLLINLSEDFIEDITLFPMVLEFVLNDSKSKEMGRARLQKYKAAGHEIKFHEFKYKKN